MSAFKVKKAKLIAIPDSSTESTSAPPPPNLYVKGFWEHPNTKTAIKFTKAYLRNDVDFITANTSAEQVTIVNGDSKGLVVHGGKAYYGVGVPTPPPGATPGIANYLQLFNETVTYIGRGEIIDVLVACGFSQVLVLTQSTFHIKCPTSDATLTYTELTPYIFSFGEGEVVSFLYIFFLNGANTEFLNQCSTLSGNTVVPPQLLPGSGKRKTDCCKKMKCKCDHRQYIDCSKAFTSPNMTNAQLYNNLFAFGFFAQQVEIWPDTAIVSAVGNPAFFPIAGIYVGKTGLAQIFQNILSVVAPLPAGNFAIANTSFTSCDGRRIIVQLDLNLNNHCVGNPNITEQIIDTTLSIFDFDKDGVVTTEAILYNLGSVNDFFINCPAVDGTFGAVNCPQTSLIASNATIPRAFPKTLKLSHEPKFLNSSLVKTTPSNFYIKGFWENPNVQTAIKQTKAFLRNDAEYLLSHNIDEVITGVNADANGLVVYGGSYYGLGVPPPPPGVPPGLAQYLDKFTTAVTRIGKGKILDVLVTCGFYRVFILTQSVYQTKCDTGTATLTYTDITPYIFSFGEGGQVTVINIFGLNIDNTVFLTQCANQSGNIIIPFTPIQGLEKRKTDCCKKPKKKCKCKHHKFIDCAEMFTSPNITTAQYLLYLFDNDLFTQLIDAWSNETVLTVLGDTNVVPTAGVYVGKTGLAEVLAKFASIFFPLPAGSFGIQNATFSSCDGKRIVVQDDSNLNIHCPNDFSKFFFSVNTSFYVITYDDNGVPLTTVDMYNNGNLNEFFLSCP